MLCLSGGKGEQQTNKNLVILKANIIKINDKYIRWQKKYMRLTSLRTRLKKNGDTILQDCSWVKQKENRKEYCNLQLIVMLSLFSLFCNVERQSKILLYITIRDIPEHNTCVCISSPVTIFPTVRRAGISTEGDGCLNKSRTFSIWH